MYKAVSKVAYIFGAKCYNFFRRFLPLPHETLLQKEMSPIIDKYVENFFNINDIDKIINDFLPKIPSSEVMHATLAIDAAAFKEIKGDRILQRFQSINTIKSDSKYNNIFVFFCSK